MSALPALTAFATPKSAQFHAVSLSVAAVAGLATLGVTSVMLPPPAMFLGWAAFSPNSRIRARIWSFDEAQRIDAAFIHDRIAQAVAAAQRAAASAEQLQQGVRRLPRQLRPADLDTLGLGAALLSGWAVHQDIAEGRLVHLLPRWRGPALPVHLLYPNPPAPTARLRYFIEAMRRSMSEPLWPDLSSAP